MKFSDLERCPFCGYDEFYTNDYYTGTSAYNQRFDGEEPTDNSQMYDGLTHHSGARAYCGSCWKYLGSYRNNKVGKKAEQALKGGAEQ